MSARVALLFSSFFSLSRPPLFRVLCLSTLATLPGWVSWPQPSGLNLRFFSCSYASWCFRCLLFSALSYRCFFAALASHFGNLCSVLVFGRCSYLCRGLPLSLRHPVSRGFTLLSALSRIISTFSPLVRVYWHSRLFNVPSPLRPFVFLRPCLRLWIGLSLGFLLVFMFSGRNSCLLFRLPHLVWVVTRLSRFSVGRVSSRFVSYILAGPVIPLPLRLPWVFLCVPSSGCRLGSAPGSFCRGAFGLGLGSPSRRLWRFALASPWGSRPCHFDSPVGPRRPAFSAGLFLIFFVSSFSAFASFVVNAFL